MPPHIQEFKGRTRPNPFLIGFNQHLKCLCDTHLHPVRRHNDIEHLIMVSMSSTSPSPISRSTQDVQSTQTRILMIISILSMSITCYAQSSQIQVSMNVTYVDFVGKLQTAHIQQLPESGQFQFQHGTLTEFCGRLLNSSCVMTDASICGVLCFFT